MECSLDCGLSLLDRTQTGPDLLQISWCLQSKPAVMEFMLGLCPSGSMSDSGV